MPDNCEICWSDREYPGLRHVDLFTFEKSGLGYINIRVVVEAGTFETETETWVAETKTKAI